MSTLAQALPAYLAQAIDATSTSFTIRGLTDSRGTPITSMIGTVMSATIEPQSTSNQEIVSWTGLTSLGNNIVQVTGVTRNINPVPPYNALTGDRPHAANVQIILSDTALVWSKVPQIDQDTTVTGNWTFTIPPISPSNPDASTTAKGVTRLSVAPVTSTIPIAVGDNDSRITAVPANTAVISALTGIFFPYGGSSAPTGFLLCDGSAVSRATYSALFAILGTTYGAGDGSTTFNLPDGRGRSFIGAGTGIKVATFASRASNVISVTGLTNNANNEFQTGQAVTYATTSGAMGGLTAGSTYYVVRVTNTSFSLATSLANAQNGTLITLTSDGSGTQTFTLTLTSRTRGDTGGEENHAMSSAELLAHSHTVAIPTSNPSGTGLSATSANSGTQTYTSSTAGGNQAMNIESPYFTGNWLVKT